MSTLKSQIKTHLFLYVTLVILIIDFLVVSSEWLGLLTIQNHDILQHNRTICIATLIIGLYNLGHDKKDQKNRR